MLHIIYGLILSLIAHPSRQLVFFYLHCLCSRLLKGKCFVKVQYRLENVFIFRPDVQSAADAGKWGSTVKFCPWAPQEVNQIPVRITSRQMCTLMLQPLPQSAVFARCVNLTL